MLLYKPLTDLDCNMKNNLVTLDPFARWPRTSNRMGTQIEANPDQLSAFISELPGSMLVKYLAFDVLQFGEPREEEGSIELDRYRFN